ncbi:hypothetical protein AMS68_007838 [Peltaster fructicola]|uniref:Major facilitator superfamily (MFS) profile domain-containing protein n=1 Tax=Peltaster fructicola TaxID=286661 RepID=A0A6H0Y652_9PEZI|nr:hypothetical protein AMS68_007838 [Peltaster fructicola]
MVIESATGFFHAGKEVGDYGAHQHEYAMERTPTLQPIETFQTTYEQPMEGKLYQNGVLVLQPAASRDPKDPMNLPLSRKLGGVICLSFFGALAASAEIILGALLPVFALNYSTLPVSVLWTTFADGFPEGSISLSFLQIVPGCPPIVEIFLLAALPVLMIGLSNLFLVPFAIAIGRRPVLLVTGCIAIAGAVWAGKSESLGSHLAARCVQALGAGTVESLIPFIIQDMIHVHERNTWISAAFACQGVIIIAIGFSAPYMVVNLSWRWIYYVTAIGGGFFLTGTFFFLPETRWNRTRSEMNGIPRDDAGVEYTPRTWLYDLMPFHGPVNMTKGLFALLDTLRTFFYPQILFITLLNSAMISTAFSASYTTAPALLTKPWSWRFQNLGLCLVPVLISAIICGAVTGAVADKFANWCAKKRGSREPENQLVNLILPTILGLCGAVMFGIAGNNPSKYHWIILLVGLGFMAFGFLGANSVGAVYVLECYPHLAGPALVNIAAFRCIFAFCLTFYVADWIIAMGYLNTFLIYAGLIAGLSLALPVVYIFGPAWRRRWPATNLGRH